jgi:hypothetical protein
MRVTPPNQLSSFCNAAAFTSGALEPVSMAVTPGFIPAEPNKNIKTKCERKENDQNPVAFHLSLRLAQNVYGGCT